MKYLKIALKSLLVLLLFLGLSLISLYHYYDHELPQGEQGEAADQLAQKMLVAMNYDAYKELDYIEWSFSSRGRGRSYSWYKRQARCTVAWDSISVDLNLNALKKSNIQVNGAAYKGELEKDYISSAKAKFNNDTFWLVAPFKLFDKGVERRLVKQNNASDALLVTYTSGGNTPGDSYLWFLDEDYKPKAFQMWVSLIPIGGIEATWEKWQQTANGAFLPRLHKVLFLDLEITNLKAH